MRSNRGLKEKIGILIFRIKTLNVFKKDFVINPEQRAGAEAIMKYLQSHVNGW